MTHQDFERWLIEQINKAQTGTASLQHSGAPDYVVKNARNDAIAFGIVLARFQHEVMNGAEPYLPGVSAPDVIPSEIKGWTNNPNGFLNDEELPVIYGVCLRHDGQNVFGQAIAEDGTVLVEYTSSNELWLQSDLGVVNLGDPRVHRPFYWDKFDEKYPNGWRTVYVPFGLADHHGALQAIMNEKKIIRFRYCNWEGKLGNRRVIPEKLWWGSTPWHEEECWLLTAFDIDKGEVRDFDITRIVYEEGGALPHYPIAHA